jgi:RNA polymerase sigma-70 factor (ECF subfamily)
VAVLAVVYLVFNEGYFTGTGSIVVRRDLCNEAIRLARLLTELLPNEPEATGLLALLSLQHSRRDARLTENGSLILLEDQDRSRWHLDEIDVARRLVEDALRSRRVGPYQVQAAIAALHAEAMSYAETDWPQIVALYGVLLRMTPSPVIELNRAVAIAMDKGPERGLEAIENAKLGEALDDYRWYHTTLGRLLQKAGRPSEAVRAYQTALSRITNQSEREYVEERLRMLGDVAPA